MNLNYLEFSHFTSKEKYCKLQMYFGKFDIKRNFEHDITEPINNFTITSYHYDEFSRIEDYSSLSFMEDFIVPGIANLGNRSIYNFKLSINEKGVFTKELLSGYSKYYVDRLTATDKLIAEAKYLGDGIKSLLKSELNMVFNFVTQYFENPYPNIQEKLKFNWNRTEVLYFFHLLRKNGVINKIEDSDFGRIIDAVFEYRGTGSEYKAIRNSRKHINNFKNDSRSVKNVNDRIKNLFMNEDFYNV